MASTFLSLAAFADSAYISIIVDDMGHSQARGERAINLPAPLTFAILPYSAHAGYLAEKAHRSGREIMVHMPMENVSGEEIGPGGLTASLPQAEFLRLLNDAVSKVPFATGINNHMGSLLTTQPVEMNWLMTEIKRRELFFIDSRTSTETVAQNVAVAHAVFSSRRDVFLDNDRNAEAIEAEFERLVALARQNGTAIAIGHPYQVTLDFLAEKLPTLAARGIRVVPVSHAIALQRILAARAADAAKADAGATDQAASNDRASSIASARSSEPS